jgi:hypothetical protein
MEHHGQASPAAQALMMMDTVDPEEKMIDSRRNNETTVIQS